MGIVSIVVGSLSLIASILYESSALAFIGLGCAFWGLTLFLITPSKYVEGSLLENTVESSYMTLDRITRELNYQKTSYCIPPYPQDVYLPEHLKGLKEAVVFIPAEDNSKLPPIEELSKCKFQVENPKGILINPPGIGLLGRIEEKLHKDSSKIKIGELCEVLPPIIQDNFRLVKEVTLFQKENTINLRIYDSIYQNLYSKENGLKSINMLGCPIVNAIACALAKSSGKPVSIEKIRISAEAIDVSYHIAEIEAGTEMIGISYPLIEAGVGKA